VIGYSPAAIDPTIVAIEKILAIVISVSCRKSREGSALPNPRARGITSE